MKIQELLDYNANLNKIWAKELIKKIRKKSLSRGKQGFSTYRNYNWMYKQLVTKEKSFQKVADMCPVVRGTIYSWAKKLEIPFMSVSKRMKIVMNYPNEKARLIKKMKEVMNRPDVKERCRNGAKKSAITKKKNGTTSREMWKNTEYRVKTLKAMAKGLNLKPNNLERFFDKLTPECVKYVGDFSLWIKTKKGSRNPDFIVGNQKKVIELFGDFWHKGEDTKDKIEEYAEVGWQCIVFWEFEVYNETNRILKETLKFIGEN